MSFLRVKKRVKFNVELTVVSLSDVPLISGIIFAKVRLLECGSFEGFTWHCPVHAYKVDFLKSNSNFSRSLVVASLTTIDGNNDTESGNTETGSNILEENPQPFQFQCRIPFDERTGELEECQCKISLRKECRGGKAPQKLGFVILNLSEFAASGTVGISQSFLLDGYTDGGQRQDNSLANVHIKMIHQAQDPLFKVPKTTMSAMQEAQLNPADRKAPSANNSVSSTGAMGLGFFNSNNLPNLAETASASQSRLVGDHLLFHHHFDDRPISCTNFGSNLLNQGVDSLKEQRASWHAGVPVGCSVNDTAYTDVAGCSVSTVDSSSGVRRPSDDQLIVSSIASSSGLSAPTSVSSGLGPVNCGSLANRIQKTRRDASGVIDEVFAETSALLAVEAPSTSALSWEGIGGGSYEAENLSHDDDFDFNDDNHLQRVGINHILFGNIRSDMDLGKTTLNKSNVEGTSSGGGGLALLVSKDRKSASVTSNSDIRLMSSTPLNNDLIDDVSSLKNTKFGTVPPLSSRRLGLSTFMTLANGTPPSSVHKF